MKAEFYAIISSIYCSTEWIGKRKTATKKFGFSESCQISRTVKGRASRLPKRVQRRLQDFKPSSTCCLCDIDKVVALSRRLL